ncbi:MAG: FtsQ-type POTRA domain-containing protein, partial [Pseudomonadota bacterium]
MSDTIEPEPNARTWRQIPQPVRPRAMSRVGRKRFVLAGLKTAGLVGLTGAVGWGLLAMTDAWQSEPRRIARAVGMAPVGRIELQTDGAIDRAWVEKALVLPRNITLMELDLPPLQQRLLASGQVRSVVLTKTFPSTLTVKITERRPVARLRAETGRDFIVARDGVVFTGIGYDPALTESLPWLAGVKLVREGEGFAPIPGLETVADLLAMARSEAPQLYRTWQVVNLARFASDGEIEVHSSEIERIVFSRSLDFYAQLARLDYIRDAPRPAP